MFQRVFRTQVFAALLTATTALASDDMPTKLHHPAEIVIIGDGETMDALQRALEEEVTVINEEGGVMGRPLKIIRTTASCTSEYEKAKKEAREVASRNPILIFERTCPSRYNPSSNFYASKGILVMQIALDEPCSPLTPSNATLFCLSPASHAMGELAFDIAAGTPSDVVLIFPREPANAHAALTVKKELLQGFSATSQEEERWGQLLAPPDYRVHVKSYSPAHGRTHPETRTIAETLAALPRSTIILFSPPEDINPIITAATSNGWEGKLYYFLHDNQEPNSLTLPKLPPESEVFEVQRKFFYLGKPPEGAKAYAAFHPDWVAGFWQVMKTIKYAHSLDGPEIAKDLGGPPFFSRAPWLMLQSRSRYQPRELRQRFNDSGDLRMARYKFEKIWPKQ